VHEHHACQQRCFFSIAAVSVLHEPRHGFAPRKYPPLCSRQRSPDEAAARGHPAIPHTTRQNELLDHSTMPREKMHIWSDAVQRPVVAQRAASTTG
jgi:hypothetical protein